MIFEFPTERDKAFTLAILDGIKTDLNAFSHPALSEPELEMRRHALDNAVRIAMGTNFVGEYTPWRKRARRYNLIVATLSSMFFAGLAAFGWATTGQWWNVVGDLTFALMVWAYFILANQVLGSQETLDKFKLPLPPTNIKATNLQ